MKGSEIRRKFSEFFERKAHEKIASSSLIPHNDKTLLFANAGMNQFKDYFTGKERPKIPRAVTIQKCVRAGGKHNDLENVGLTARHHTFFEMLGNFSFGDYFKEEAIAFAWEFLTVELGISKDKLLVTVHHSDDEALEIWNKQIGVPLDRIFKKGDKDNFWEMGEFGPCGPCSEIFYDHGEKYTPAGFKIPEGGDLLDDEGRYVEIWNLVFMQYEKTPEGTHSLPKPSIDTGSGLERVTAAMQGVYWNYDTDLFSPIINKLEALSGKKYSDEKYQSNFRVVADHIRSSTMLITDGVMPSNEGRGYVLRRIIRRAIRHMKELGAPALSLHKLVPVVFEILGEEYPQNKNNMALAEKFLHLEEKKFLETLDQGLKFLEDAISTSVKDGVLAGEGVFKLYDTYGFPVDLTEVILSEKGLKADVAGFETLMDQRRKESRKTWKGGANLDDKVFFQAKEACGPTQFLGYKELTSEAKLLKVIPMGDDQAGLVFDKTPFYGEGGGQMGDIGEILIGDQVIAEVEDTQKPVDGLWVHTVKNYDLFEEGSSYTLKVNAHHRRLTMRNHSATHLLQSALIEVLGDHVKQAGSSVAFDRLRFDFTHHQAMTKEEITKVEELVNKQIQLSLDVSAEEMSMDDAIAKGALALFGEKYGDKVRVLTMGKFSTELCGGTHVSNTGEIGLFKVLFETSLSAGVRRIEATTSETAIAYLNERSEYLKEIESLTNVKGAKAVERVEGLFQEMKETTKELNGLKDKIQALQSKDLFNDKEEMNGFTLVNAKAPEGADFKKLADLFGDKAQKSVLILHGAKGDKLQLLVKATADLKEIDCGKLLKAGLAVAGGRGGGRKDMAQGSGDLGDINQVIAAIKSELK